MKFRENWSDHNKWKDTVRFATVSRMVEIRSAQTRWDSQAEGIHLTDPTKEELEFAIERAAIKGFSTVWIEETS